MGDDKQRMKVPVSSNLIVEFWTEEQLSPQANRKPRGSDSVVGFEDLSRLNSGVKITDRDLRMLDFLSRFKFATAEQLARLTEMPVKGTIARLNKLSSYGVLTRHKITAGMVLYTPTQLALSLVESPYEPIETIYPSQIAHELALGNVGIDIENGGDASPLPGGEKHRVITTREIMTADTSMSRLGEGESSGAAASLGLRWAEQKDALARWGENPELTGAGIYAIYYNREDENDRISLHYPDMVIPKEPGQHGPETFGVEVELTKKPDADVLNILTAFKKSPTIGSVIYYTHAGAIASQVRRIGEQVGVPVLVRRYVPKKPGQPFWG